MTPASTSSITVHSAPRYVLAAQSHWREAMECEPVRFMVDELPGALLAVRGRLAGFVGAVPQRLTFVDNATAGANAVLRSLRWKARERIVIADHAYPGVKNAARFVAERLAIVDHVFAPLARVFG